MLYLLLLLNRRLAAGLGHHHERRGQKPKTGCHRRLNYQTLMWSIPGAFSSLQSCCIRNLTKKPTADVSILSMMSSSIKLSITRFLSLSLYTHRAPTHTHTIPTAEENGRRKQSRSSALIDPYPPPHTQRPLTHRATTFLSLFLFTSGWRQPMLFTCRPLLRASFRQLIIEHGQFKMIRHTHT